MSNKDPSFEIQILKRGSVLLFFTSLVSFIICIFLDMEQGIALCIFSAISTFILWYLMKNPTNFKFVRIAFTILIICLINLVWYYNYASFGPVLGLYILACMVIVFIWPLKFSIHFAIFFVLNILLMFYIELQFTDKLFKYSSAEIRLIDVYLTSLLTIIVGYIFSRLVKSDYLGKYEEARKSDEMKTAFLHNMSHELRTPLNAIIGFSGIINDETSLEEIIKFNKIIHTSGNHLLSLVDDLMAITLIDSGVTKVMKEEVNLESLLLEIHEQMLFEQKKLENCKLDVQLKIPKNNANLWMQTDHSKLTQLLIILLKNALKFTNEGSITYGYTVESEKNKSYLKLFVTDTGIGIDKKSKDLIFNAFWQFDRSHTRTYDGVGIGLTISKRLAELLGGKLSVESAIGKGSTFYFTIPYNNNQILNGVKNVSSILNTKISSVKKKYLMRKAY